MRKQCEFTLQNLAVRNYADSTTQLLNLIKQTEMVKRSHLFLVHYAAQFLLWIGSPIGVSILGGIGKLTTG